MKRIILPLCSLLLLTTPGHQIQAQEQSATRTDSIRIDQALRLIGLDFTWEEIRQMQRGVQGNIAGYESIRNHPVPNDLSPSLYFDPLPPGYPVPPAEIKPKFTERQGVVKPQNPADLAFMTISELAWLMKNKQVTSMELTRLYLDRLKLFNDSLLCVVSLTEERALKQAALADREIASGLYRGLLHGIPYGVKDLMAVPGYPTTWGAMPYLDQKLDMTAAVVERLDEAGAVLVAKLTTGALAMGDVWYGGRTRNPWDMKQGSSGSSAGPAAATAAGLVAFAIGTETLGSIVSPSTRCGVTGLRPTPGRVSKFGTMALSWSMDKIGPICRSAIDCAIVLDAIRGYDPRDPSTREAGFEFHSIPDLKSLRIGYLPDLFAQDYPYRINDSLALEQFRKLGANLTPAELPGQFPVNAMRIILNAEAAAAFNDLTLSDRDSLLVSQTQGSWPNIFRTARLIPAVEYIQANRIRTALIQAMNETMSHFDLIIVPTFGGNQLTLTNLTGHPCLLLPNGFDDSGHPTSISLIGNLYREGILCAVAGLYQEQTRNNLQKPPYFYKQ